MPRTTPMAPITVRLSGYENPARVVRGSTVVAVVFTDLEPGDQYQTAPLFAAAPQMLAALRLAADINPLGSVENAAARDAARAAIAAAEPNLPEDEPQG